MLGPRGAGALLESPLRDTDTPPALAADCDTRASGPIGEPRRLPSEKTKVIETWM